MFKICASTPLTHSDKGVVHVCASALIYQCGSDKVLLAPIPTFQRHIKIFREFFICLELLWSPAINSCCSVSSSCNSAVPVRPLLSEDHNRAVKAWTHSTPNWASPKSSSIAKLYLRVKMGILRKSIYDMLVWHTVGDMYCLTSLYNYSVIFLVARPFTLKNVSSLVCSTFYAC